MSRRAQQISFVPQLLADQTLYSWVAMFHSLSGNISPDETRRQLFGSEKAGLHFHIPSHLTAFCAHTQLALGDVRKLVATATVLPFFTRFRPRTVTDDTIALVAGKSAAGLPQMLHMDSKPPYWALPKKSCPDCIHLDHERLGFAYWRRAHQLPGALVCHQHGVELHFEESIHSLSTSSFLTPTRQTPSATHHQTVRVNWANNPTALRLAILARDMADSGFEGASSRSSLLSSCQKQIAIRFASTMSRFRPDPLAMSSDFTRHFESVILAPEIGTIIGQRGIRALWMLLEGSESHAHPLEWMLIIDWLYGNWSNFELSFRQ